MVTVVIQINGKSATAYKSPPAPPKMNVRALALKSEA